MEKFRVDKFCAVPLKRPADKQARDHEKEGDAERARKLDNIHHPHMGDAHAFHGAERNMHLSDQDDGHTLHIVDPIDP